MKKKELMLDFTSLLDVIMILLFVVISNMSQASLSANEEANKALNEAQIQIEEVQGERDNLLAQIEIAQQFEEKYAEANLAMEEQQAKYEELQTKYEELQDEYDYLKITSDYDAHDTTVYEAAIERMAKLILICNTAKNTDTGNQEVKVHIYLDSGMEKQTYVDVAVIEHNLNLSKEERAKFNAEQVTEMTKVLSGVLRNEEKEMIWFSVQYAYDDENFSNTDLQIINEAINNLERSFSKSCFVEEIKLY